MVSEWHSMEWWLEYERKHDDYLVGLLRCLTKDQREWYEIYRERGCGIAQSLSHFFDLRDT